MRRAVAIVAWTTWAAATAAPRRAAADAPRATFGLAPTPAPSPSLECSDGLVFGCPIATDPFADASPYGLTTHLPTDYLRALPAADATYDAVASHVLGGGSDGAGPSFGGATGLENRWTIDGAPTDDLRTGEALGRHVSYGADDITRTGQIAVAPDLRQAEVGDPDRAVGVE